MYMQSIPVQEIEKIRRLREGGESIKVVARIVGRSPATVKKYTDDIVLPAHVLRALRARGIREVTARAKLSPEKLKARARKSVASRIANGSQNGASSERMAQLAEKASLMYRRDELPVLEKLNGLFNSSFAKEKVGGVYFDFADDLHLIEHSIDGTHGVQDATMRFAIAEALGDKRCRIAYMNTGKIGSLRMQRFTDLNVEVRDVAELV